MKALFLSEQNALAPGGGGQQLCTREYIETLQLAGFELTELGFATDRALATRIRRKLRPVPYANVIPADYFARVESAVRAVNPTFIFCNLYNSLPLASRLRDMASPATRLVFLSHGLASVDEVHAARIANELPDQAHLPPVEDNRIGSMLRFEARALHVFDHVFCLAEFEVEICRWLGARSVSWCPRILRPGGFLNWKPIGDRIGVVGTIDHPPNLEGIERFCAAVNAVGAGQLRLRLITRSRAVAASISERYPFIDDLGPLDTPSALEAEAATWSAFVHPIFCYAMGCSTKVATGLNWGLPVLTSTAGFRGYTWEQGRLPALDSPQQMAQHALEILECTHAAALRAEVLKAAQSGPSPARVAAQMRTDLGLPPL